MSIMLPAANRGKYEAALWTSAIFITASLVDGWLKIALLRGPLIHFWIFDLTKWLVLPAVLILALRRSADVRPQGYGLTSTHGVGGILALVPLVLITLYVAYAAPAYLANQVLGHPEPPFSSPDTLASLGRFWIVGSIYFSVTAGLWESIFIIGLPWLWFSQGAPVPRNRTVLFVVVSSLLFALGHWENGLPNVIAAFVFEVCAVWWYLRLKTLWPVIVAHTLIDLYDFWPWAQT